MYCETPAEDLYRASIWGALPSRPTMPATWSVLPGIPDGYPPLVVMFWMSGEQPCAMDVGEDWLSSPLLRLLMVMVRSPVCVGWTSMAMRYPAIYSSTVRTVSICRSVTSWDMRLAESFSSAR